MKLMTTIAAAPCFWAFVALSPTIAKETIPTAQPHDIRQYGAVADGQTLSTKAIQNAIDTASTTGGGTVFIPTGTWLTGTLRLKDNVTVHLEPGATLLGSTDINDYPVIWPEFKSFTDTYVCQSLIYAEKARNIAITGQGTIDGQGDHETFKHNRDQHPDREYGYRPYLIRMVSCRKIVVRDVTLVDSPMWVQQYLACDDVLLDNVGVYSFVNHNNDMIDIDCCKNVRIINCTGDSGDDAITLKSTADRITENVTVTNCVVSSHCNAIKCGTESNGGFRNITMSNIAIRPSKLSADRGYKTHKGLAGIALELVDGGVMDRVTISNIVMEGTTSPIFLRLGNRARPFTKGGPKPGVGRMRNIVISNVICTGAKNVGCPISGIPGHPIENVTLRDVKLSFDGGGTLDHVSREIPENESAYPESKMFGTLPAYGFYARHVDGLTLDNVDVRWADTDRRAALFCDDVRNLTVNNLTARCIKDGAPAVIFNDVSSALVRGCIAPADAGVFCRLAGQTRNVTFIGNDLSHVARPFEFVAPASEAALCARANRLPGDKP